MSEIYPETTKVGFMEFDTVKIMKEMDPVGWRCGQSDWESQEESDETIISFDNGSNYYWMHDLENFLTAEAS